MQALASRGRAACAGGLDGLWTRGTREAAWQHAPLRGGLPSNDIAALAADGDTLWVGTFDHGLATLTNGHWKTIDVPGLDARIDAIVVAPDAVWVGTAEGLVAVSRDGNRVIARFTRSDGLPGRSVLSLVRLSDGRIAVGSSSGAAVIDNGRLERVGPQGGLGHERVGNVWAIADGSAGTLWLGTTTGLYHGAATAWAGKDGGDASVAGAWTRFSVASGALRDDWVTAIATRGDAVWVGTYKGGVTRIDLTSATVATALGDGWINPAGLVWDGDHLLVSTMDGLRSGDGATNAWTTTSGLPGRDVTASVRIGGTLWVATRRGLAR